MNFDLVAHLKTKPTIALVGATNDHSKYGNIIFRDLVRKGFHVLPINPKATTVEGEKAYPDLKAAKTDSDIGLVVYVIPPKLTQQSLAEASSLGLKKVWVQPGAGDESVREFLEDNSFEFLMDACVMVESLN